MSQTLLYSVCLQTSQTSVPKISVYNRFAELQKKVALTLAVFIKEVLHGTCTGIAYVDSTPLRACKHQRIPIHKTFKGLAERGSALWDGFRLQTASCNQ